MKVETYIAHSEKVDEKHGLHYPCQYYGDHIDGVYRICDRHLNDKKSVMNDLGIFKVMSVSVRLAALYHDLGKLDPQAQGILNGSDGKMINHVDAGVAYMLSRYEDTNKLEFLIAAYVILGHHIGLPNIDRVIKEGRDFLSIIIKPLQGFRDNRSCERYGLRSTSVSSRIDDRLHHYIKIHNSICKAQEPKGSPNQIDCLRFIQSPIALKIALSILVDSDHEDTSIHYSQIYPSRQIPLNASEKIEKLDAYVADKRREFLNGDIDVSEDRFVMRQKFYDACGDVKVADGFYLIDGTVGIGKTLGLFKTMLVLADKLGKNTMTFVLPYISLIDQSADAYLKSIFNDESNMAFNVIHSVFPSRSAFHRKYQKGFNAPINMSTSVNIFGIMGSNNTGTIQNLHKFVGNIFGIDEFHAIASYEHWPTLLHIMKDLNDLFGCHFVFSSGTPIRYWDLEDLSSDYDIDIDVENVISDEFYAKMVAVENTRLRVVNSIDHEWVFEDLSREVLKNNGSVFVILGTRVKAAKFVKVLKNKTCRKVFLRFSGLSPKDRKIQFGMIKQAMKDGEDIVVVATEGSDIGLDLSFKVGYKELSRYDSIVQHGGRINRGFEYEDSFLHVFKLSTHANNDRKRYYSNPTTLYRSYAFENNTRLWNSISPDNCVFAAQQEISNMSSDLRSSMDKMIRSFRERQFEDFEDEFKIIKAPMISLLVDHDIFCKIMNKEFVPYSDIQDNTVNIFLSEKNLEILDELAILVEEEMEKEDEEQESSFSYSGLYYWNGSYDHLLFGILEDPIWGIMDSEALIT